MSTYCLCKLTGDVPRQARDSQGCGPADGQCFQAPNRYSTVKKEITEETGKILRPIMLGQQMEVVQNGVPQEVPADGSKPPRNNWLKTRDEIAEELKIFRTARRHYPNLDLYRCPNCGAEVVRDA